MSLAPDDLASVGRTLAGRELMASAATLMVRPQLMARLLHLYDTAERLAEIVPDILTHPEVARAMVACIVEGEAVGSDHSRGHRKPVMQRSRALWKKTRTGRFT